MRIRVIIGLFLSVVGIALDIVHTIADIWILRLLGYILVLAGIVIAVPALSRGANARKKVIIGVSLFITSILFTIAAEITDMWIFKSVDSTLMSAGMWIGIPAMLTLQNSKKNTNDPTESQQAECDNQNS